MELRDKQHNAILQTVAYLIMVGFTLLTILPLVWLAYSSLKPHAAIVENIFALPALRGYRVTEVSLKDFEKEGMPSKMITNLRRLENQTFSTKAKFLEAVNTQMAKDQISNEDIGKYEDVILTHAKLSLSALFLNYTRAWKLGNMGIYSMNSIFFSVVSTFVTTLLALTTGYGIAKFGYKISKVIYAAFLLGLLLTVHSILVPLFVMEIKLGIADTRIGLLLPYIAFGLPFLVYLATSFIKGLPAEIEESATIDGANYLQVFWYVILPISRPVVATMMIFRFLGAWNEFALVFVLTSKATLRTLPVGINAFAGGMTRDFGMQFAALMIGTLPMIIFYIFFNERIQQGFASGGLKE